jgi:steroid delta-isomerase-like uncharacterized protein
MGDWIDSYLDAWNRHDSAALVGFMTDEVVYTDQALGATHRGKADVKKFIEDFESQMSTDYKFEHVRSLTTDDGYFIEWVVSGTNDRGGDQMPATGKRFNVRGVSVGDLSGGKIKRNVDYWSLAELLGQVGLMPTPAATS